MPTGYTHTIEEGIQFNDFVLNCARALGYLVSMRDEPMSKPIPDEIKAESYHLDRLNEAKAKLEALKSLSKVVCVRRAKAEYEKEKASNAGVIANHAVLRLKYKNMLKQVKAWTPPTENHVSLKKFMLEQIETSLELDCNDERYLKPVKQLTGETWKAKQIASAKNDIEYHTKEYAQDVKQAKDATEWIKALKDSL